MKTIRILLLLSLFGVFLNVNAQKTKVGTINTAELLESMPAYDSIQTVYEQAYLAKQNEYKQIIDEFTKLQDEYTKNEATWSESYKSLKRSTLEGMSNSIQGFEANVQKELGDLMQTLQEPLTKKIKSAIEEVAKENGYTQIIDSSQGLVLFSDPAYDIMDLVKKKLNIVAK